MLLHCFQGNIHTTMQYGFQQALASIESFTISSIMNVYKFSRCFFEFWKWSVESQGCQKVQRFTTWVCFVSLLREFWLLKKNLQSFSLEPLLIFNKNYRILCFYHLGLFKTWLPMVQKRRQSLARGNVCYSELLTHVLFLMILAFWNVRFYSFLSLLISYSQWVHMLALTANILRCGRNS